MKIMVLEADPQEQALISDMLNDCEVVYETKIARAINRLGIQTIDHAFVDADFGDENRTYSYEELTSFLNLLDIDYSVFSSNGKVGIKNGQVIVSIHDIPKVMEEASN